MYPFLYLCKSKSRLPILIEFPSNELCRVHHIVISNETF